MAIFSIINFGCIDSVDDYDICRNIKPIFKDENNTIHLKVGNKILKLSSKKEFISSDLSMEYFLNKIAIKEFKTHSVSPSRGTINIDGNFYQVLGYIDNNRLEILKDDYQLADLNDTIVEYYQGKFDIYHILNDLNIEHPRYYYNLNTYVHIAIYKDGIHILYHTDKGLRFEEMKKTRGVGTPSKTVGIFQLMYRFYPISDLGTFIDIKVPMNEQCFYTEANKSP